MLCSLLRAFKVFFVGNAYYSSTTTVHSDKNLSTVAITYTLQHSTLHIDNSITIINDYQYRHCFPQKHTDRYIYLSHDLHQKLKKIDRLPSFYHLSDSQLYKKQYKRTRVDPTTQNRSTYTVPLKPSDKHNYFSTPPSTHPSKPTPTSHHSNKQHSNKHHSNEHHSNKQHSNKQHSNKQHSNGHHSNEHHSNKQHSNKQHSNEQHSNKQHSNGHHSNEHHSNKHHSNKQHSNKQHSNGQHSNEQHSNKHHSNKHHSNKHHSNEHHSNKQHSNGHHSNEHHSNKQHSNGHHSNEHHSNKQHSDTVVHSTPHIAIRPITRHNDVQYKTVTQTNNLSESSKKNITNHSHHLEEKPKIFNITSNSHPTLHFTVHNVSHPKHNNSKKKDQVNITTNSNFHSGQSSNHLNHSSSISLQIQHSDKNNITYTNTILHTDKNTSSLNVSNKGSNSHTSHTIVVFTPSRRFVQPVHSRSISNTTSVSSSFHRILPINQSTSHIIIPDHHTKTNKHKSDKEHRHYEQEQEQEDDSDYEHKHRQYHSDSESDRDD